MRQASIFISLVLLFAGLSSFAQQTGNGLIGGTVVDDGGIPIIQAGVQLLSASDSSVVKGTVTDPDGCFILGASAGDYILRFSFIGFGTKCLGVHRSSSQEHQDIGTVTLNPETTLLDASVVRANANAVTVMADTLVFSTAAYHVADDASVGDLLKKIPGLEIGEDGAVRLFGKEVKRLLLNGKLYFGGSVKTGLSNIPAYMIDNIEAYDRPSEYTRLTGIDDGEEEPVLDLKVKKSMMDGWRGSTAGGYGTSERYGLRLDANNIGKEDQRALIVNLNNTGGTPSRNTVDRNVTGNGSRGEKKMREGGYTFSCENEKRKIEGHARYSGDTGLLESTGSTTGFYASGTSYGTSTVGSQSGNDTYSAGVNILLKAGPKVSVQIHPDFQYRKTDNTRFSRSKTFSADPATLEDPSSRQSNSTSSSSVEDSGNLSAGLSGIVTYRFGKKNASNLSLKLEGNCSDVLKDNLFDNVSYVKATSDVGSTRKQAVRTADNTFSTRANVSANILLKKNWRANLSLTWNHRDSYSERMVYDLGAVDPSWTISQPKPAAYADGFVGELSSSGKYSFDQLILYSGLYYSKNKFTVSSGLELRPQWGLLQYGGTGEDLSLTTFKCTASPRISVKFNRMRNRKFQFTFKSWAGTPSLYNLLPVTNGTSITTVHTGNPDLLPSMNHKATLSYNSSNREKHSSLICNVNFKMVSNDVSNSSDYNLETGVRTIVPRNIDGNWQTFGNIGWNKSFRDTRFSIGSNTSAGYYNTMSYLYNKVLKADQTNRATRLMARQFVDASFRQDRIELVLNAGADITRERSLLRPDLDRTPYSLRGGCSVELYLPWKMRLGTDFSIVAQRGLAFEQINGNYCLLGADLSQSVLHGNGTVKIEAFDILGQQKNVVQSFSSESRTIRQYNGVNRYVIAKFIYRFGR